MKRKLINFDIKYVLSLIINQSKIYDFSMLENIFVEITKFLINMSKIE